MGRHLVTTVPIHEKDGTVTWYGPGDEVPEDVAAKIQDKAWADDEESLDQPTPKRGRGRGPKPAVE